MIKKLRLADKMECNFFIIWKLNEDNLGEEEYSFQ